MHTRSFAIAAITGALSLSGVAQGTVADTCRAMKLKAIGSLSACRLRLAAATARTDSGMLDPQHCDATFALRWYAAERRGTVGCGTIARTAVRDALGMCADSIVAALAGGPPLIPGGPGAAPLSADARRPATNLCESRKIQATADYHACRSLAEARAVRADRAVDASTCDRTFTSAWRRIEMAATDGCPSLGDESAVQDFMIRTIDGFAAVLSGGGPLPSCDVIAGWPALNRDPANSRANPYETAIPPGDVALLTPRWNVSGLSAVTGTPTVVDGVVYFGDWSGGVHARRADDGSELWHRTFPSAVRAAVMVAGERVYAAESGGTLHALRRDTGADVWAIPLDSQPLLSIDSSPIMAGGTIVIGVASFEQGIRKPDYSFRGNVVGVDADSGAIAWRVYTSQNDATSGAGVSIWSSAAVDYARKLVFIGTGQTYEQPASPRGDSVVAIHYETGAVAWVHQFTAGDVFTVSGGGPGPDADVGGSPNLFAIDGRDVVGVGQKNGVYHVLDRSTGAVVWEKALTAGSPLGGIMVTAAEHAGVVYVNSNKWTVFGIFQGVNSPLDTSTTFALDARTGAILWQRNMPAPMFGAMSYANGLVFQGTIDGTVHALSAQDGSELWHDAPGGGVAGGFSIVDGTLYVGRGFWFFAPPPSPNGGLVAYAIPPAHWVGTWSTSPLSFQAASLFGLSASTRFENQTLRMIVRTSLGGDAVRVRLSNDFGDTPLSIGAASVGLRATGASLVAGTAHPLTFGGHTSVTIPPHATITSDPIPMTLPPQSDLAVTFYLPALTVPTTSHPQAATGYVSGAGDFTADVDGTSFGTTVRQWFFLDAVDVRAPLDRSSIVAFGDSIIDGAGSTYDANTRWPDFLARRLLDAGKPFGVLNQGINGNKVLNSLLGDSALTRFDRDVLGQAGVKYVIFLEGINDIGLGAPDVTADQVIAGYRNLIARAHAAGLKIFAGTLTPAKDTPIPFYAPYNEAKRAAINEFIRTGGEFDAFFDYDAAVRNPADPVHWLPGFSTDGIHPTDAGAEAIANATDLSLFQ